MRCALISDVHGNLQALRAVLDDIGRRGVSEIYCLGDTVGYGADPSLCLKEVLEATDRIVAGNHDHGAVGMTDLSFFNANARRAAEWTAQALSAGERKKLKSLPLVMKGKSGGDGFLAVHSTPHRPDDWHYILSLDEAEYQFEQFNQQLCFVGHSHQPAFWECDPRGKCRLSGREYAHLEPGHRYIVNVGSVGQPRDGDPRAAYAICDLERMDISVRRVEYDIKTAQQRIIKAGLPSRLAERLAVGL